MIYLKEFATEADVTMDVSPNVVYVNDTKKVLYNVAPMGVFIQHIDGSLHTMEAWTAAGFTGEQANGVAVNAKECGFVISKTSLDSMAWSSDTGNEVAGILTTSTKSVALTDFSGQENTALMLATDTNRAGYTCANYTFPNGEKGYLPALGEWNTAYANKAAIDEAMTLIGGTALGSNYYWSSTQDSARYAWRLTWDDGSTDYYGKFYNFYVRAFSALTL